MTPGTFYQTLAGMAAAVVVAIVAVHLLGRWHDRQDREAAMTGAAPSWHPDADAWLSGDDWDVLDGIQAATEGRADTGLGILGSEGDGR